MGNARFVAIALVQLGEAFSDAGRDADALRTWDEALERCRAIGNRRHEAVVLRNLGRRAAERGEREAAIAHYQAALAGAREVKDARLEARVRELLAELGPTVD